MILRILVLLALVGAPFEVVDARERGTRIVRVAPDNRLRRVARASNREAERARLLRAEALIRKALPDICKGC